MKRTCRHGKIDNCRPIRAHKACIAYIQPRNVPGMKPSMFVAFRLSPRHLAKPVVSPFSIRELLAGSGGTQSVWPPATSYICPLDNPRINIHGSHVAGRDWRFISMSIELSPPFSKISGLGPTAQELGRTMDKGFSCEGRADHCPCRDLARDKSLH